MAAATILLRRSSAYLMSGSQFYCRHLSTATKRSRLFVPTVMSSVRQFSSSPAVNNIQTPTSDLKHANNINQQPLNNDQLVQKLIEELGSLKGEIESLKEAKSPRPEEEEKEEEKEEVAVVKEKHPLLKEIESAISKAQFRNREYMIPYGFQVECDKPGVAKVTMKQSYKKEIIRIEVSNPTYYEVESEEESEDESEDQSEYHSEDESEDPPYEMKLVVQVRFSRIFSSTAAEFHCTASKGELAIDKIKDPSDGPHCEGVIFEKLPESLQKEFYEYLEVRGVDCYTTHMLHNYMAEKMKRENTRALGKFKKLVEDA